MNLKELAEMIGKFDASEGLKPAALGALMDFAAKALAAAGNSQYQDADQLYKVIRGYGYTTSSQTSELVAAIAAMGKQEGGERE